MIIGIFIVPYKKTVEIVPVVEINDNNKNEYEKANEIVKHKIIHNNPTACALHSGLFADITTLLRKSVNHCNSLPIPIPKPTIIQNNNPYVSANSSRNDA